MTFEHVLVEDVEPGIVRVTLDRPEKRNALSHEVRVTLRRVAEALDERDDLSAILLTGNGPLFCAGADLSEADSFGAGVDMAHARRLVRSGSEMCTAWERVRPLTIAVVHGAAIGGGLSLAVACDFRILAAGTVLHAPEVELGINYSWNSLPRIGNLVGPARAKLIGALGRRIDAETALAWGLCETVAGESQSSALAAALDLAREIASKPRIAQQMVKEAVNRHFAMPNTIDLDQDQILLMARDSATQEVQATIRAKFRKP